MDRSLFLHVNGKGTELTLQFFSHTDHSNRFTLELHSSIHTQKFVQNVYTNKRLGRLLGVKATWRKLELNL